MQWSTSINVVVSNIWQVCDNLQGFLDFSLVVLWVISVCFFLLYIFSSSSFCFIVVCFFFSLLFVYGPTRDALCQLNRSSVLHKCSKNYLK